MNLKTFLLNHFSLPIIKGEISFCFYIEKKARLGKDHVIHSKACELLPDRSGRIKLGEFENFEKILLAGKKEFKHVRLCSFCCKH